MSRVDLHDTEQASYHPSIPVGSRVRLVKSSHSQNTQAAVILRPLPNPSQREQHQWYDVRFDNGVYGRFLGRYLEPTLKS